MTRQPPRGLRRRRHARRQPAPHPRRDAGRLRPRRPAAAGARRGARRSSGCRCPRRWRRSSPHLPEADGAAPRRALPRRLRRPARRGGGRRGAALSRRARGARPAVRPSPGRCSASPPARPGAGSTTSSRPTTSAASSPPRRPPTAIPRSRTPRCCSRPSPRPAPGAGGRSMVGDTEFDVAMGRAAGMATIGVAWGYHPRERLRGRRRRHDHRRASTRSTPPSHRLGTGARDLGPAPRASGGRRRCGRRPDGFAVALDERPLRTPAGARLLAPTAALAAAIAAEWDALEAEIDPERLPLTRAANSAIDRVAPQREAVVDAIAEYGGTDLLCYRAAGPDALVARQAAGWDPWLAWSARALAAPLVAVTGVMHQPPAAGEPRGPPGRGGRGGCLRPGGASRARRPLGLARARPRGRPPARSTRARPGSCRASTRRGRPSNGARRRGRGRGRGPPRRLPARARRSRRCSIARRSRMRQYRATDDQSTIHRANIVNEP